MRIEFRTTLAATSLAAFVLMALPLPAAAQGTPTISDSFERAIVQEITREYEDNSFPDIQRTVQEVTLRIVSGPDSGTTFTVENGIVDARDDMRLVEDETVVVEKLVKSNGEVEYQIRDKYRLPAMLWLTAFFVALTVIFGGITGLTSICGLGVSILILLWFVIPGIVAGQDPMAVSLIGSGMIACTSLYLAHGFSRRTSVALLSTLVTLGVAAVLALLFVYGSKLFGLGSEEAMFLQIGQLQNVNLRGLLLGGIIIGCLGVLDDITTAQTATIDEISKANPSLTAAQLRKAGYSVGKEHIASLINTLALAYVGASLPLLLLFEVQGDYPLWVTINGEFLAEEIIRTLVGSATLLVAVPISTWFASVLLRAAPGQKPQKPNRLSHSHGHSHA